MFFLGETLRAHRPFQPRGSTAAERLRASGLTRVDLGGNSPRNEKEFRSSLIKIHFHAITCGACRWSVLHHFDFSTRHLTKKVVHLSIDFIRSSSWNSVQLSVASASENILLLKLLFFSDLVFLLRQSHQRLAPRCTVSVIVEHRVHIFNPSLSTWLLLRAYS